MARSLMSDEKIVNIQLFYGGEAQDDKIGIPNSFAQSESMDFRKRPSQISVLPATRKISSGNVVDLVQNIIQTPNGVRYALGDAGNFYKIDNNNVFSLEGNLDNGAYGMLYRRDTDYIYMASTTTVSQYGQIMNPNSTPTPAINKYQQSASTAATALTTGGTASYTTPTAISESPANKCLFETDIEPGYSIKIRVLNKGTGNFTLTLHDDAQNVYATVTIPNASLVNNALNEFVFPTQVRLLVSPNAREYHWHITSTVGDGTVAVASAGDLTDADMEFWAYRLVSPINGMHPMVQFLQYVLIGNEQYLSQWEPLSDTPSNAEWLRHRLTFPTGFEVCGITATDEFVVIGCEKRASNTREFQEGKLYIWDGLSETYNQIIDVPEGSPYSLATHDNLPYFIVNGALYCWPGGKNIVKVRTFPGTDTEFSDETDQTINYPYMLTNRRNVLLAGYPSQTTSTQLKYGVWSWGQIEKNYPMSFGYSYKMSTGAQYLNATNDLRIGCVSNFGDELYIAWRDDDHDEYGVDIVDNLSDPASTYSWESLIFDAGAVYKQKMASRLQVNFKELPADVTITPKWKIDRSSTWTLSDRTATAGDRRITIDFGQNRRFNEIQFGFDGTCDGDDPPEITGIAFEYNSLPGEDPLLP